MSSCLVTMCRVYRTSIHLPAFIYMNLVSIQSRNLAICNTTNVDAVHTQKTYLSQTTHKRFRLNSLAGHSYSWCEIQEILFEHYIARSRFKLHFELYVSRMSWFKALIRHEIVAFCATTLLWMKSAQSLPLIFDGKSCVYHI